MKSRHDWRTGWDPRSRWKNTSDFLAYRDELVEQTLTVAAEWRNSAAVSAKSDRMKYFCARIEKLVRDADASDELPSPSGLEIASLASDLADLLSVLPQTDCWDRHEIDREAGLMSTPAVCEGCPFVKQVPGLSGGQLYFACDVLAFMGEKIVEWRSGFPAEAWPEPGVWYSAFEANPDKH